jgi:hypothetical protein
VDECAACFGSIYRPHQAQIKVCEKINLKYVYNMLLINQLKAQPQKYTKYCAVLSFGDTQKYLF